MKWPEVIPLYRGDLIHPPQLSTKEIVLLTGDNGIGKSSMVSFLNTHFSEIFPVLKWGLVSQSRLAPLGERSAQDLIETLSGAIDGFKFVDHFSLGRLLSRPINKLSGGENQKLKISLGFSLGQDYVILDEPTNNLDVGGIDQLCSMILDYKKSARGMLIVSHQHQQFSSLISMRWHMKMKLSVNKDTASEELEIIEVPIG